MGWHSDYVEGACDCCKRARWSDNKGGFWYCTAHQDDYFPDAPWDGEDEFEPTSCPSFSPDPDCYDEDDWVWDNDDDDDDDDDDDY